MKQRLADKTQPSQSITLTRSETIVMLIPTGVALSAETLAELSNAGQGPGGIAGGLVQEHDISAWTIEQ